MGRWVRGVDVVVVVIAGTTAVDDRGRRDR